ncbi:chromatin modification-related protein EAF6 [Pelomyxa schiedti]|nr:chromatin modification-related protein EAF6 [Pelomyxa schiedti]
MAHSKPGGELAELLRKKEELDAKLVALEKQIYALEGNYLEETQHVGNIVKGWGGYLMKVPPAKKAKVVSEYDRLFSLSSCTSPASRTIQLEANRHNRNLHNGTSPASTTQLHTATTHGKGKGKGKRQPTKPRKNAAHSHKS